MTHSGHLAFLSDILQKWSNWPQSNSSIFFVSVCKNNIKVFSAKLAFSKVYFQEAL